jgi:hypothetical protein
MRIRFGLGVLVGLVVLLAAPTAWACLTSSGTASPDTAGPGDPISFSISGIQHGADYTVFAEDRVVASGVNQTSHDGVMGSFPMPDLGDQRQTVYVYMEAEHDEDGYGPVRHTDKVEYVPPVSAQRNPAESKPPASRPVDQKQTRRSTVQKAFESASDSRRPSGGSPVQSGGSGPGQDIGSNPGSGSPDPGSAANQESARESARESSSVPDGVASALSSKTAVGPAEVPTLALGVTAIIFVLGTALAAFVIYLLQTGPDPRAAIKAPAPLGPDPVDVELQEMIADEMARQLLSDLDLPGAGDGARLPG